MSALPSFSSLGHSENMSSNNLMEGNSVMGVQASTGTNIPGMFEKIGGSRKKRRGGRHSRQSRRGGKSRKNKKGGRSRSHRHKRKS